MTTTPNREPDDPVIDCNTFFGSRPKQGSTFTPENLVEKLRERGVERTVSISLQGVYHDFEKGNLETLSASKSSQEFIIPACTIDPRRFYGQGGELGLEKFAVLRLFPDRQGWPVDYAPFHKIIDIAASAGIPVMIPAGGKGRPTRIAKAAKDYAIPIILTSVNYSTLSEILVLLGDNPNLYITNDMLNTPDGVELFCEQAGPERLLFGSNFPLTYLQGPLITIKKAQIPRTSKIKILKENAERILICDDH